MREPRRALVNSLRIEPLAETFALPLTGLVNLSFNICFQVLADSRRPVDLPLRVFLFFRILILVQNVFLDDRFVVIVNEVPVIIERAIEPHKENVGGLLLLGCLALVVPGHRIHEPVE